MANVDVSQSKGKQKHGKKKASKRIGFRIDMTPMVDVMMLLLTFFMFTTTMNKPQTMEINLPPSNTKADVAESNLLTLRITDDFTIFWNIGVEKPVTVDGADKLVGILRVGANSLLFHADQVLQACDDRLPLRRPNLLVIARHLLGIFPLVDRRVVVAVAAFVWVHGEVLRSHFVGRHDAAHHHLRGEVGGLRQVSL